MLILYSNIIAWPAAYFIVKRWLQSFEYQTGIQIWIFILASCLALGIGLLTINIQTIRAASANPVESLRYE